MNFSTGEIVGLAWMLSGVAAFLARVVSIGVFGIFHDELQQMYDRRADMSEYTLDIYYKVAQARRAARISNVRPRLRDVIGLPLTIIISAAYVVLHLLFGPIMFLAVHPDRSNRS